MDWPDNHPGLDVHKILSNINGKTGLYLKLLRIFMDNHRQDAANIRQSIATQDWKQAHMQAHSLKGVSSNIGAVEVSEVCQRIEEKTKGDPSDLQDDLQQLEAAFAQAITSIEEFLHLNPPSE